MKNRNEIIDEMIEILTAIKTRKPVEYRLIDEPDIWINLTDSIPIDFTKYEYRLKLSTNRFRVAEMSRDSNTYLLIIYSDAVAKNTEENSHYFVKWCTGWVEYGAKTD